MRPVVFLDRDGVINADSSQYIKTPDEFEFLPRSLDAMSLLYRRGFDLFVVTNQSVIGRHMTSPDELEAIFHKMRTGAEQAGAVIQDIFFCPHHPEDRCSCRKPLPGLIHQAVDKYGMDPARACMVGDSIKDILCARAAGVGCHVLVRTGNGVRAEVELNRRQIFPDFIGQDLFEAACWIVDTLD